MQRHFNDYWTISFYNKRKYSICCKWSKTKKYLRTEFKTNCLGLCWVWWRGTATQKFPLLPSPSTRSPFPSVGQRLTSFSSLFLFNFFSISSHCSSVFLLTPTQYFFSPLLSISSHPCSDVGASCRASAGARPSPRAPRISRTSWWWSTSPGGLANTNYLFARFTRFCVSATSFKLNMISGCRDEQEVVISMGGRVEEVKVVFMVEQLNHFDSTTNLFPLQNLQRKSFSESCCYKWPPR